MKKLYAFIGFTLWMLNATAQEKKWQYGFGVDVFQSKLVNISKDYDMKFHSVPYYTQYDYGGISPGIHIIRHLNERWSLKSGLSFIHHQSKFHFVYTDHLGIDIDATLRNQYSYLVVPLIARYHLLQRKNSQVTIGAGVLNKICWNYNSNFPEINNIMLIIPVTTARTFVVAGRIEAGYGWNFSNHSSIGLGVFLSRDMTTYLGRNAGFMNNLKPSRYLFGGLGLSYTFK